MDCSKNCIFPGDFKEDFTNKQINLQVEKKKKITVNQLSLNFIRSATEDTKGVEEDN